MEPVPEPVAAAMDLALSAAAAAGVAGDVPVGAAVVIDGEVVAVAANERERRGDPTAHAEILALQAAASQVPGWRLAGATLVSTLEPCPMCTGAALAARVERIVFGAADLRGGACGSLYNLGADPRLGHEIGIVAGLAADAATDLLTAFFDERRAPRLA